MSEKNVLVTGASHGIGKACAVLFAKKGCRVFINCKTSTKELFALENELTTQGFFCRALPGDVGNPDDVKHIFRQLETVGDGVDILINNAGISYIGLLTDMTDSDWKNILDTNLSSVFYCSREALPHMISQKKGKILNISSMWGRVGASCEVAYSAAKAGVNGFTMALAKELAPSNIQVNAIACGVIDTRMNEAFSPEERRALADEIPAGRFGTPEEAAHLAWDLTQNHSYLTGQIIGLDGGFI